MLVGPVNQKIFGFGVSVIAIFDFL
jgi:hypothetical protein